REVLDVCVIPVVHPAQLAYALEQVAVVAAVLAEPGTYQPQGEPVRIAPPEIDREAERYRDRRRFLLHDYGAVAFERWGRRHLECQRLAGGKRLEIVADAAREVVGIAAREPDREVVDRVIALVERLHVMQRERLEVADVTQVERAVGMIGAVDLGVEHFLAKLLVIVTDQARADGVHELRADPAEVLLAPAR